MNESATLESRLNIVNNFFTTTPHSGSGLTVELAPDTADYADAEMDTSGA